MKLKKDKRGVFGLTAVQQFFAIILGLAILAYVIVIIMGTLSDAKIIPTGTLSNAVTNETLASVTETGVNTAYYGLDGATCTTSLCILANATGTVITSTNYTTTGCNVKYVGKLAAPTGWNNTNWKCSYSYTYNTPMVAGSKNIMTNVSTGVTGFFSSINPVFAILAILVIILVLVVLVRVVQSPSGREGTPQL